MSQKPVNGFLKYLRMALVIFLVGIIALILAGPFIGNVFSTINNSLNPVPTSSQITPTQTSGDELSSIDNVLNQTMTASIAFNAPQAMKLEETVTIELVIDPAVSEEEIIKQIEAEGEIQTGALLVTPLTKATLIAQNGQAFEIQPLHDSEIQPVDAREGPTTWQWQVTSKKGGTQILTLVIYRLIQFEGAEYWRQVESYRADINVEVSFGQHILAFDWKWLGGLLITSLIIPLFMRWLDKRKPSAKKRR